MANETKHTPGEWKAVPDLQGRFQIETPHGSIAWLSMADDRAAEQEVIANARLMAAAPDMLEAMIECRDAVRAMSECCIAADQSEQKAKLARFDAAIAKATSPNNEKASAI